MSAIGRPVSKLSGYAPAIPTPFDDAGTVDGAALEQFCDRQIKQRATPLAVCGTIGEASAARACLQLCQHLALIRMGQSSYRFCQGCIIGSAARVFETASGAN